MFDGTCDDECNTLACNWDGDDCDDISPSEGATDKRSSFYQSIDFVDVLFSRNIGIGRFRISDALVYSRHYVTGYV